VPLASLAAQVKELRGTVIGVREWVIGGDDAPGSRTALEVTEVTVDLARS
jgi:hypothetical protein